MVKADIPAANLDPDSPLFHPTYTLRFDTSSTLILSPYNIEFIEEAVHAPSLASIGITQDTVCAMYARGSSIQYNHAAAIQLITTGGVSSTIDQGLLMQSHAFVLLETICTNRPASPFCNAVCRCTFSNAASEQFASTATWFTDPQSTPTASGWCASTNLGVEVCTDEFRRKVLSRTATETTMASITPLCLAAVRPHQSVNDALCSPGFSFDETGVKSLRSIFSSSLPNTATSLANSVQYAISLSSELTSAPNICKATMLSRFTFTDLVPANHSDVLTLGADFTFGVRNVRSARCPLLSPTLPRTCRRPQSVMPFGCDHFMASQKAVRNSPGSTQVPRSINVCSPCSSSIHQYSGALRNIITEANATQDCMPVWVGNRAAPFIPDAMLLPLAPQSTLPTATYQYIQTPIACGRNSVTAEGLSVLQVPSSSLIFNASSTGYTITELATTPTSGSAGACRVCPDNHYRPFTTPADSRQAHVRPTSLEEINAASTCISCAANTTRIPPTHVGPWFPHCIANNGLLPSKLDIYNYLQAIPVFAAQLGVLLPSCSHISMTYQQFRLWDTTACTSCAQLASASAPAPLLAQIAQQYGPFISRPGGSCFACPLGSIARTDTYVSRGYNLNGARTFDACSPCAEFATPTFDPASGQWVCTTCPVSQAIVVRISSGIALALSEGAGLDTSTRIIYLEWQGSAASPTRPLLVGLLAPATHRLPFFTTASCEPTATCPANAPLLPESASRGRSPGRVCTPCSAGFAPPSANVAVGSLQCTPCPFNTFHNVSAAACSACPAGTSSPTYNINNFILRRALSALTDVVPGFDPRITIQRCTSATPGPSADVQAAIDILVPASARAAAASSNGVWLTDGWAITGRLIIFSQTQEATETKADFVARTTALCTSAQPLDDAAAQIASATACYGVSFVPTHDHTGALLAIGYGDVTAKFAGLAWVVSPAVANVVVAARAVPFNSTACISNDWYDLSQVISPSTTPAHAMVSLITTLANVVANTSSYGSSSSVIQLTPLPGSNFNVTVLQHLVDARMPLNLLTLLSPYLATSQHATCETCAPGWFSLAGSACIPCPSPYVGQGDRTGCTECPPNTFSSSSGLTTCSPCPFNTSRASGELVCTYANGTMATSVPDTTLTCRPGYRISGTEHDSLGQLVAVICDPCLPGTYSNSIVATQCTPCPPGLATNVFASTVCLPCAQNLYASSAGLCQSCRVNEVSSPGSTQCTACPAGSNRPDLDMLACTPCAINFAAPTNGSFCRACASGTDTKLQIGATQCTPCPLWKYRYEYQAQCEYCGAGYEYNVATSMCKPCGVHKFTPPPHGWDPADPRMLTANLTCIDCAEPNYVSTPLQRPTACRDPFDTSNLQSPPSPAVRPPLNPDFGSKMAVNPYWQTVTTITSIIVTVFCISVFWRDKPVDATST